MIGNDVVDLRDPETRPGAVHARFDARVFTPVEVDRLRRCERPNVERWRLWTAKESAFKAARRSTPALVFAPSRFRVEEDELGERVMIGERAYHVSWRTEDGGVHAVARDAGVPGGDVLCAAARRPGLAPSGEARRLAIETVAAALGLAPHGVRVEMTGRVPSLRVGSEGSLALSLSHHGEMVAFAAWGIAE